MNQQNQFAWMGGISGGVAGGVSGGLTTAMGLSTVGAIATALVVGVITGAAVFLVGIYFSRRAACQRKTPE